MGLGSDAALGEVDIHIQYRVHHFELLDGNRRVRQEVAVAYCFRAIRVYSIMVERLTGSSRAPPDCGARVQRIPRNAPNAIGGPACWSHGCLPWPARRARCRDAT